MQRTQFGAKSAKNDLKPKDFLKRNFHLELEGVAWRSELRCRNYKFSSKCGIGPQFGVNIPFFDGEAGLLHGGS
jgi:hypothetical protein